MKISLTMIVRDEEAVLERCLKSAAGLFDEIIVADTGSTDKTPEIARSFGAQVHDFKWVDDFSAARNYALSWASGDYVMWLDADDVIENPEDFRRLFLQIGRERPDVVMLPYNVGFDGERVTLKYERERIFRNRAGFLFEGAVHEAVCPRGKILRGSAAVSHRKLGPGVPGRNLRIYQKLIDSGKPLSPRDRYYYARELCFSGRQKEAIPWYESCADDLSAWIDNRVSAAFELSCILYDTDPEKSESLLGRSLLMREPRADICCEIGRRALLKKDYDTSIFWYSLAPVQFKKDLGGFVGEDYGGLIPFLQLCVICDRLGRYDEAERYNRMAESIAPENPAVRQNKNYFENLRK